MSETWKKTWRRHSVEVSRSLSSCSQLKTKKLEDCKYFLSIKNISFFLFFPSAAKDPKRKSLSNDLQAEESIFKQSIEKLKVVEANRLALVSQLKDALNEQVLRIASSAIHLPFFVSNEIIVFY